MTGRHVRRTRASKKSKRIAVVVGWIAAHVVFSYLKSDCLRWLIGEFVRWLFS